MSRVDGSRVRELMRKQGVKNRELAQQAGIDPGSLSAILNGHQYVGEGRVARIEKALRELGISKEEVSS